MELPFPIIFLWLFVYCLIGGAFVGASKHLKEPLPFCGRRLFGYAIEGVSLGALSFGLSIHLYKRYLTPDLTVNIELISFIVGCASLIPWFSIKKIRYFLWSKIFKNGDSTKIPIKSDILEVFTVEQLQELICVAYRQKLDQVEFINKINLGKPEENET